MTLSQLRSLAFAVDHDQCRFPQCGRRATELSHIFPRGMGGTPDGRRNQLNNVMAACPIHARITDHELPEGWSAKDAGAEWSLVPGVFDEMLAHGRRMCLARWVSRQRMLDGWIGDEGRKGSDAGGNGSGEVPGPPVSDQQEVAGG